jgi:formylglycine-generating enzyme required for sulfatase activity
MTAVVKRLVSTGAAALGILYGLLYGVAQIAWGDLEVPPPSTIVPGDALVESDRVTALWIDREGIARVDRDGALATVGRYGTPTRNAFLLSGGTEALTISQDGTARIVELDGARLRSILDMPRLRDVMRDGLWSPYIGPAARWVLFAAAQVFPLDIPEPLRGRRGRAFRDCADCPEMIEINPGYFLMGSPITEAGRHINESPRRLVSIDRLFAVGRFAVTFAEWDACEQDGGCNGYKPDDGGSGRGRHPVINVSWENANAYVTWLSKKTDKKYRLLSEVEREYVTRAGTTTPYWWGSTILVGQANFERRPKKAGADIEDLKGLTESIRRRLTPEKIQKLRKELDISGPSSPTTSSPEELRPKLQINAETVDAFAPNPWGLYQVHGNVWEWVEDCYHPSYAGMPTTTANGGRSWTTDCEKLGDKDERVVRGGSWLDDILMLRSATRRTGTPDGLGINIGFRVARTL